MWLVVTILESASLETRLSNLDISSTALTLSLRKDCISSQIHGIKCPGATDNVTQKNNNYSLPVALQILIQAWPVGN